MPASLSELDFDCPRCKAVTRATFYGPCSSCCDELQATMGSEARDIEVAAYEPKMNVVPNQIATKE
ncbi:MAG: hypothetical protein P8N02_06985 [Actinomycetota bacterium]|jgi:hypothetical protein|nr:hypothetical protein [Actinomycetota bacterium]